MDHPYRERGLPEASRGVAAQPGSMRAASRGSLRGRTGTHEVVPNQRLVGFIRVSLDPGQAKDVRVSFPVTELAVTPGDIEDTGSPRVELGGYQVQVGTMSQSFTIHG